MCSDSSTKICTKCGIAKPLSEFSLKHKNASRLDSRCKACVRKISAEWYAQNKERRRETAKQWSEKNRDKENAAKRARRKRISDLKPKVENPPFDPVQWRKNNKDKLSGYRRAWLAKNPMAAISDRYRRRLNAALANFGVKKLRSSSDFLGCTWTEFALHIERQFLPGMSWENRDQWHLDHLVPISTAKTEADVIALNHFTNLRPMWAKDNLAKGDAIHYLI